MSEPTAELTELMAAPEVWLSDARLLDLGRGRANLEKLSRCGMTADLVLSVLRQIREHLPKVSDPDMAWNNFERFVAAARSPLALGALFDRERTGIPILLLIFSNSQYLADLLIRDPEAYDSLRMTEGQPIERAVLVDDLANEMASATETRQAMAILRRFKQRETLRIAFGDLIAQQRLSVVAEQISFVAEAICQCAFTFCYQQLQKKWGVPRNRLGQEIPFVIMALGKLGGGELNYSSDIDLIMVSGEQGECDGPRGRSSPEFFEELTRDFTKLLTEVTGRGFAYRVDLRLRPEGSQGRLVNTRASLLQYYENKGRTWERQAWIKARPVAGSFALGAEILHDLRPWIYRTHLNRFDITGVKALKRQIEKRAVVEGVERTNIKTGWGGIRDVEFVIQFLQLLHGGANPQVQTVNTLKAIERLQLAGCLVIHEETLLAQNYIFLRQLEHRLQLMYDLQTHELPASPDDLRKIAIRMSYVDLFGQSALSQFQTDLAETTEINRRILDHLLHTAFTVEQDEEVPPVVDLIFAAEPTAAEQLAAFADYGFADPASAAKNFISCSIENIPFLSQHRCRHFFAAIAPRLLREVNATPSPDHTLIHLRSVSENLGAKGVLWELFAVAPLARQLFVRLCAGAEYLVGILRSNPGMIDELVDALLVEELPDRSWLSATLADLVQGAEQLDPIVHSFKQAQHLRVGVRDLVGQVSQEDVNRSLSQIADTCLERVADACYRRLQAKFGTPGPSRDGGNRPCRYALVACGKWAGEEINYQSDLDLLFLFENEGQTSGGSLGSTSHQHFFSQWGAEVTKAVTSAGPFGKLYDLDSRLRPFGKSSSLATSADEWRRYFSSGVGQSWERLVLAKSRVVMATGGWETSVEELLCECLTATPWGPAVVDEVWAMRLRMQQDASQGNLKRGPGGTVDIEFLTQLFQLKYIRDYPQLRTANTTQSLNRQVAIGLLEPDDCQVLIANYAWLRSVESAVRLTSAAPRSSLPVDPVAIRQIDFLLRRNDPRTLPQQLEEVQRSNRALLLHYLERLRQT